MSTKFSEFLTQSKIDSRRLLVISRRIERLRPEDRRLRLERRNKKSDDKKEEGKDQGKPHSGRPVTPRLLQRAQTADAKLTGPQKTRLLRAVNRILEQKKKDPVDLRTLF